MEENKVTETGMERLVRLRKEAKKWDITGQMTADEFEAAIAGAKATDSKATGGKIESKTGLAPEEAAKIDARLKYEDEVREKFKRQRQIEIERATIVAESKSLHIAIDLPENPTELQLATARRTLGMKKQEVKPSPETLGIEAGKRGYYIFTNLEQEDAGHTVNPGGKYTIELVPDQIHVLSDYHIKLFRKNAVVPVYKRVPVPGSVGEGQIQELSKRTGSKPRFSFEHLGEAPKDAPFGLVTDTKILEELKQEQLS